MKVFTFKVILLLSIIIGVLFYLSEFSVPNHHYLNTVNDFHRILDKKNKIDVAIYGSSHAYCSYNPRIIDSITKTRSFNFGNDAQRVIVSKYILKETLKNIGPKVVILDVYPPSIANPEGLKALSFQKSSYYYFNFSFKKMMSAFEVFPIYDAINLLVPVLNRKDFKYNIEDFHKNHMYRHPIAAKATEYRGFVGYDLLMKDKLHITQQSVLSLKSKIRNYEGRNDKFTNQERENIISFINDAKLSGAEVLLVVAPYFAAFNSTNDYLGFFNYIDELSKETNVKLLDFNLEWSLIGLNNKDFKDKGHLNINGANKVSKYLGEYINSNFKLPSRENEKAWLNEQPINILKFVQTKYSKYKKSLNFQMTNDLLFESFNIVDINSSKNLIIKLDDKVNDSILKKYKLGFHTYVSNSNKEKLMAYSKIKNRNYDAWDFNPEIKVINGSKFIIKPFKTRINSFTKVKLFLYNRSGYKGLIGKSLEIDNIEVE